MANYYSNPAYPNNVAGMSNVSPAMSNVSPAMSNVAPAATKGMVSPMTKGYTSPAYSSCGTSTGVILVLFILLVIIGRSWAV